MGFRLPKDLELKILSLANVNPVEGASEKEFQAAVEAQAQRLGWEPYHTYDSRRSHAGFPDLILIRNGVLIVAELKVGKNKTTPEQEKWLSLFAKVPGVRVFRWRPEMWTEILKELQ